jgi:hypothetical protein
MQRFDLTRMFDRCVQKTASYQDAKSEVAGANNKPFYKLSVLCGDQSPTLFLGWFKA